VYFVYVYIIKNRVMQVFKRKIRWQVHSPPFFQVNIGCHKDCMCDHVTPMPQIHELLTWYPEVYGQIVLPPILFKGSPKIDICLQDITNDFNLSISRRPTVHSLFWAWHMSSDNLA
jgi:hypothetical protein